MHEIFDKRNSQMQLTALKVNLETEHAHQSVS